MAGKRFESKYKLSHTFEYRQKEAAKVRQRHPDRLPVICEKVEDSPITELDKSKYLVPADLSIGQFVVVLRKRVMLDPEKAVFLFIGESVPPNAAQMSDLYARYKDEDGFLYIKYSGENTFGGEWEEMKADEEEE